MSGVVAEFQGRKALEALVVLVLLLLCIAGMALAQEAADRWRRRRGRDKW